MLSIEQCRELIPDDEKLTDIQIEEIRTSLYELGELALEDYIKKKKL